jgi:deoxyribonuclease-4
MANAKFGPGGNSESFYAEGHKSTIEAPAWVAARGLDAYEYEAGNGLTAGEATLRKIGEEAKKHGVLMSFHTPYFISLSGVEEEKRLKSISYIQKSLWAAELLGADTIVIHCGSAAKISRAEAVSLAIDTLEKTIETVGDTPIHLGIETMGKVNQLGTLEEVVEICKRDRHLYPVVDFGHMNARAIGGYYTDADSYRRTFDYIGRELGDEIARTLHCHFSKIEYTAAGEKKHLTFADEVYGPNFEPLMEAIAKDSLTPTIICESDGTQAEDALAMKTSYEAFLAQK